MALLQIDSVLSFGASLFGNRFLYRAQHYTTKPKQAYRLRKPYQDKYGPYGDNLIHTVRFICLLKQATPKGMTYPKKMVFCYQNCSDLLQGLLYLAVLAYCEKKMF